MKKRMKQWLAMLLAVLMVLSLVPTDAITVLAAEESTVSEQSSDQTEWQQKTTGLFVTNNILWDGDTISKIGDEGEEGSFRSTDVTTNYGGGCVAFRYVQEDGSWIPISEDQLSYDQSMISFRSVGTVEYDEQTVNVYETQFLTNTDENSISVYYGLESITINETPPLYGFYQNSWISKENFIQNELELTQNTTIYCLVDPFCEGETYNYFDTEEPISVWYYDKKSNDCSCYYIYRQYVKICYHFLP